MNHHGRDGTCSDKGFQIQSNQSKYTSNKSVGKSHIYKKCQDITIEDVSVRNNSINLGRSVSTFQSVQQTNGD